MTRQDLSAVPCVFGHRPAALLQDRYDRFVRRCGQKLIHVAFTEVVLLVNVRTGNGIGIFCNTGSHLLVILS